MSLRINDLAPDFTAETTEGPISFHEWIGDKWAILFSHPRAFTAVCTTELKVAKLCDLLPASAPDSWEGRTPADNATVRTVYSSGPDKRVKLQLTYPMTTGRNFDEILRALDSIQLTAKHQVATPAQWKQGENVILTAAVTDEDAEKRFGGFTRVLPYLRTTAQPQG